MSNKQAHLHSDRQPPNQDEDNEQQQNQHGEHGQHDHSEHEHDGHGDHGDHHAHHAQMFRRRFWVSLILSIPVLVYSASLQDWFGHSAPEFTGSDWITPVLSIVIFAYGGLPFLRMAVPELEKRQPGMMTLIGLAITVSFVYSLGVWIVNAGTGFFWELVTLIDVMLLGHWIEMRSIHQASGALQELAKLMPDEAERITEGDDTETVAVSDLQNGDLVLVRPGTSVPADGEVEEGESSVNEAMITGESKPVEKTPGDEVIGGTINGDGSLRVRVQATGDETALAGIMRMVDEAQQSKSETQLLADRAAGWLFYIALTVAVITAVAWVIAVGFEVDVIKRVATVLVIACPHALGLAIPLVVAISTSLGARNGILVRDRVALEQARTVDTVIFDKTGTLTQGEFGVVDSVTADDWSDDDALALARAVEGDSEHLIARGIRAKADERDLDIPPVTGFEAIKGRGIKANHDGRTIHVGGPRLLEQLDIALPDAIQQFTDESGEKGHTVVYLIDEGQPVAAFALADLIRDESYEAIKRLHARDVAVAMLTGDSESVAQHVAEELGIDQYFAEVLPEHKEDKVHELNEQGKKVMMVGDGVNDAPALTRADIGIAIGSGTDVAIESADIILVRSNPLDIVNIFELSTATHNKMIQNLFWASAYNIVALPLAAGILAPVGIVLSPAVGALFMSLSTVIVAINAQLMRRIDLAGREKQDTESPPPQQAQPQPA